jgi:protein-tyrosine phosphatase
MEYILNRGHSLGWQHDPVASIHPNIIFGSGKMLTPEFALKKRITHVINCAQEEDSPLWFKEAFPNNYACMDAVDSLNADITSWYPKFSSTMTKFLNEPESQVIFVHCQCGINRSGFLVLLYGCLHLGYSLNDTIKSITRQRPCSLTNPAFRLQVSHFVKKHR